MNPVKTGVTYIKEIIMEKVKQLWTLAKANPKISAAVVVVVVAIYFLAT
jgi:hypothetical protein